MKPVYLLTVVTDEEDSSNVGNVFGLFEDESDAVAHGICHMEEILNEDPNFWIGIEVEIGKEWMAIALNSRYMTEHFAISIEKHEIKEKS